MPITKRTKITLESFLDAAHRKHGEKYDYSKVVIVNSKTKVAIGCPAHGMFYQLPGSHTKGFGCKKCGLIKTKLKRQMTTEDFISKSIDKHSNKYDYSKSKYINQSTKVTITCPIHGEFQQLPKDHMRGSGCNKCYKRKQSENLKLPNESFIKRAIEIHGEKYDYSKVNYQGRTIKVVIICKKHGTFEQLPGGHLAGKGCRKCSTEASSNRHRKTTSNYIIELKEIHGEKYDYSLVTYKGAFEPVTLICPEHGPFTKPARDNLKHGCKLCSRKIVGKKLRLTQQNFISRAKSIHKEKYDYSLVQYETSIDKVSIICPNHGVFEQTPSTHLSGGGCKQCAQDHFLNGPRSAKSRALSTKDFIKRAISIHDDKYDYSKVNYRSTNTQVTIICPEHGKFVQFAGNHLKGHGCPKCSGYGRTTEEFIEQAKAIHGDLYCYDEAKFKSVDKSVTIICKIHGPWEQRALGHLHGKGCPSCAKDKLRLAKREFIEKSRLVHGLKYDYSEVDYTVNHANVKITCPNHGEFYQKASSHMDGSGCPSCAYDVKRLSIQEFIKTAQSVHGERYDYSSVSYIDNLTKVQIICPTHGEFQQSPANHMSGSGCPECSLSGQYSIKAALRGDYIDSSDLDLVFYVATQHHPHELTFINIGLSSRGYFKRYRNKHPYSTDGNPDVIKLPKIFAVLLEQVILKATMEYHYRPKIKFAGGARECRTMEALPLIMEIVDEFRMSPENLLACSWVQAEAKRHNLGHLLQDTLTSPTS